jgi:hypothetical protein
MEGQTSGTQGTDEMADPKPISRDEFLALFEQALESLEPGARLRYDGYRIDPAPVACARYNDETVEPLWAVAQAGPERICYDDEEGEWGTGVLDDSGVLREWGTWGGLDAALENFPEAE